jgi:hypothetical protein
VGRDKEPLDLTQDKYVDVFKKSMEQWSKEMGENKDGSKFGYIDIQGLELQPYGTAYASA